jgi:hypothetical protein
MKTRTNQLLAVAVLFGLLALSGCEKEKKESAPVLPPMSTLSLNIEAFTTEGSAKSTDSMSNYHIVVGAITYWNVMLTLSMAIPIAAYAEAFNHEPVRVDNDTWEWSYSLDNIYSAKLVADVISDSVYFNMYISKASSYEDVLWFSGRCDMLRTGGTWTINNVNVNNDEAWLTIDWNADYEKQTSDIKYTIVIQGGEYENSYIEYGITSNTDYNAFYNLYNSKENKTFEVFYNTETHLGYVTDGINQYCWNEDFVNSNCAVEF